MYTCLACASRFSGSEVQREHYRTDWHRYNLKRKVANLPPVSAAEFAHKVLQQQELAKAASVRASFVSGCELCGKKMFYSENAYRQHLQSNRHRAAAVAAAAPSACGRACSLDRSRSNSVASDDSDTPFSLGNPAASIVVERPDRDIPDSISSDHAAATEEVGKLPDESIPEHGCLFCTQVFEAEDRTVEHMQRHHGLFIPEQTYLIDRDGLLHHLRAKLALGRVCIYCNRTYRLLEAVRQHMCDKGHCKIKYDDEESIMELSDYYDFTASYLETETLENESDWEEVDDGDESDSTIASADLGPIRIDSISLRLPHAHKTLGHRAFARYFRQNLRIRDISTTTDRLASLATSTNSHAPKSSGRNVNGLANVGQSAKAFAQQTGRYGKARFEHLRRREAFRTDVGIRANMQKHFRDQLLQ